jgi:hypothetical protein
MSDLERAIAFATEAHAGQVDKLGERYIEHCLRVMDAVSAPAKREAVLHDVLEDSASPARTLTALKRDLGLSFDEELALLVVSRLGVVGQRTYADYIAVVADFGGVPGDLAREVKVADLRDNLGRWVPEIGEDLKARYERALERLTKEKTT